MFESSPILSALAPVDTRNPVNRSHPLNRGRVAWWLALPAITGGNKFYDLMGLNPGTLANMTGASASGWHGTTRAGGWGHLLFDGVDDYVDAGNPAAFNLSNFTISAWINTPGGSVSGGTHQTPSIVRKEGSYALVVLNTNNLITGNFAGANAVSSSTIPINTWFHAVGTFDGNTAAVYINGVVAGTASNTTSTPITTSNFRISSSPSFGDEFFIGSMDDVALWNRALSVAEVLAYYNLSRQGYTGVLNRVPWWSYANAPTGVKFRRTLYRRTGSRGCVGSAA
jgi:hypothetical protein